MRMNVSMMQYILYGVGFLAQLFIALIGIYFLLRKRCTESALFFSGSLFVLLNSVLSLMIIIGSRYSFFSGMNPMRDKILTAVSSSLWVVGWICFVTGLFLLVKKYLLLEKANHN